MSHKKCQRGSVFYTVCVSIFYIMVSTLDLDGPSHGESVDSKSISVPHVRCCSLRQLVGLLGCRFGFCGSFAYFCHFASILCIHLPSDSTNPGSDSGIRLGEPCTAALVLFLQ